MARIESLSGFRIHRGRCWQKIPMAGRGPRCLTGGRLVQAAASRGRVRVGGSRAGRAPEYRGTR
jgi:hypothetical protein